MCTVNKLFLVLVFKKVFEFKEIVTRDFGGLQMILMIRAWVPDVPLKVCFYFILLFHNVFFSFKFSGGKAFINALSKSLVSYRVFLSSPGLNTYRRSYLKLLRQS